MTNAVKNDSVFVRLNTLKKGEYFTLHAINEPTINQVFVKGDYDHSSKTYICSKFHDFCLFRGLRGDTLVYTDFIF